MSKACDGFGIREPLEQRRRRTSALLLDERRGRIDHLVSLRCAKIAHEWPRRVVPSTAKGLILKILFDHAPYGTPNSLLGVPGVGGRGRDRGCLQGTGFPMIVFHAAPRHRPGAPRGRGTRL